MTNARSKIIGICFLLILSGCVSNEPRVQRVAEKCLTAETTIVASTPQIAGDTVHKISTIAKGVYIAEFQVLTVAHAVPKSASADGFSQRKRDEDNHLLLLDADTCGLPLPIASDPLRQDAAVFDCTTSESYGNVTGFEAMAVADSPLSSFAVMLRDLAIVPGDFAIGDSGKPFCNANGELIALLVSVREDAALLINTEAIRAFLN